MAAVKEGPRLPAFSRDGPSEPMYQQQQRLPDGTILAARLTRPYFAVRDPLIQERVAMLVDGEGLEPALSNIRARMFDERVLEYLVVTDWLLGQAAVPDFVDVGCVLNHKILSSVLPLHTERLVFCNPAREAQQVSGLPVKFHLSSLETAFPDGRSFPRVTCLSTIEHIGYDNSQYGITESARYSYTQEDTLCDSLTRLAELTEVDGSLLVSVPYGFREVLIHPVTGKLASQVFDHESMLRGLAVLEEKNIEAELQVFEAADDAWRRIPAVGCQARYAHGCPAARAVVFISGRKVRDQR